MHVLFWLRRSRTIPLLAGFLTCTLFGTAGMSRAASSLYPNPVYLAGTGPSSVTVGDFNGDGHPDLAVANGGSDDVSVLPGNGDGTLSAPASFAAGDAPIDIAAGDFDDEGRPD